MSTDSLAPLFHDFTDWLDAYNGRCQGNYSSFYRGGYDLTHANLECESVLCALGRISRGRPKAIDVNPTVNVDHVLRTWQGKGVMMDILNKAQNIFANRWLLVVACVLFSSSAMADLDFRSNASSVTYTHELIEGDASQPFRTVGPTTVPEGLPGYELPNRKRSNTVLGGLVESRARTGIGHYENPFTGSLVVQPGTAISQYDDGPNTAFSVMTIDFDLRWKVDGSFGPPIIPDFNIPIQAGVGAGGEAQFEAKIEWLNQAGDPIRDPFDMTGAPLSITTEGITTTSVAVDAKPILINSLPDGDRLRVKGHMIFRAKNLSAPVSMGFDAPRNYENLVKLANPIAYYQFDDDTDPESGLPDGLVMPLETAKDSTGRYNALYKGDTSTSVSLEGAGAAGIVGPSARFGGRTNYISRNLSQGTFGNPTDNNGFSVEFWFNSASNITQNSVFDGNLIVSPPDGGIDPSGSELLDFLNITQNSVFDGNLIVSPPDGGIDLSSNLTLTSQPQTLVGLSDLNGSLMQIQLNNDGSLNFFHDLDPENVENRSGLITNSNAVESGQWHHVVATHDGTNINLFLDGELESSSTAEGSFAPFSDATLWLAAIGDIGGLASPHSFFDGSLDEVALYDYALRPEDVLEHYRVANDIPSLNFFLGAVPEPTTGLLLLASCYWLAGRRGKQSYI